MKNLEKIVNETESFFYVDNVEIDKLSRELSEHMRNKLYFNPKPLKVNNNIKIEGDFSTKNLRQSFFDNCNFVNSNYSDASLAGSLFVDSFFGECNYINTNLQSCDFRNCKFQNIKSGLKYTRFADSIFSDCIFSNCIFNSVLMNGAKFTRCCFIDCEWIPISVENAVFKDTLLENVKLRKMNFEFSTFDDIELNNIKLPFPTIPYIFNGLTYLTTTSDNIRITSAKRKEGISINEYIENLDKLCEFYKYTHNYFPLTNILISKKMHKEAFASVLNGICLSIELRRFRMLKNYCKQIKYINNVSIHDRQSLYRYILNKVNRMNFQDFECENLKNYLPEVRQLLLDDLKNEKIELSITTNILSHDTEKLLLLINVIEELLENRCSYSIEMRHNSPWDFFITIFAEPNNIALIISSVSLVFSAIQTKIAVEQSLKNNMDESIDYEKINMCKAKLKKSNIVVINLTINNNGNIQVSNAESKPYNKIENGKK